MVVGGGGCSSEGVERLRMVGVGVVVVVGWAGGR